MTNNQSVRLVLIVSERTAGEYSMLLKRLLVGLADESVPVALVCPPGYDVDSVVSGAVEVIRHPVFELPFLWHQNRKMLFDKIAKFKPNILHCLCESKAGLVKQLSRQLDLPYILAVNSLQRRRGRISISSKRCAKIIVPARSIADNLAKIYPRFAERIEQINVGTFVEDSCGCFCKLGRLASMVTAGPWDSVDDFENLFGAVKHLVIDGYEFMLVVMGGGRAESQLHKLSAELGLLNIVVNVPRLESCRSVLAACDIFIQHKPNSAFNPLLLEAMSVGTAVAGCKGGVDDLIIDGKTSAVFDPDDRLSIKQTLQRLFDRREFARQLAKEAQKYLKENHTVSNMVSSVLQIYREAQQQFGSKK